MSHFIPQPFPNEYTNSHKEGNNHSSFVHERVSEFYLQNKRFVRSLCTKRDLCYFYNIWAESDVLETRANIGQSLPLFDEVISILTKPLGEEPAKLLINPSRGYWKLSWINENTKDHFIPPPPSFPTRDTYWGAPDRGDGTERVARNWAKRFYLENISFLRNTIYNRKSLAYFYKIWSHSSFATRSGFFPGENQFQYRPFSQVLFALVRDGRVCRVSKSYTNSWIIWTSTVTNPPPPFYIRDISDIISYDMVNKAIQIAINTTVKKLFEQNTSAPPVASSREDNQLIMSPFGTEPPPIIRKIRSTGIIRSLIPNTNKC